MERAKFIIKCKESVWKRWSHEYVKSPRERHVNWGEADHYTTTRDRGDQQVEAWSRERNYQRKRWDCT